MADVKGQVDWGRLAAESHSYHLPSWLSVTFEPLVNAALAAEARESIGRSGCVSPLRAALDTLPKVEG